MQINVAQLLKSPIGTSRSYDVNSVVDITGDGIGSPVQGTVELMRTDRAIIVKGTLHTVVKVTCSRCLSVFDCSLTLNMEEEYFPVVDAASGISLPAPDEPASFTIDEHHMLDLTEAIRQYTLLAIPMKPLCREDCAGLCPGCGQNLNLGDCQCPPATLDPRWAVLSRLIE